MEDRKENQKKNPEMEEFTAWLAGQAAAAREEIAGLEREGRKDEADFAKVRTNIYDVCATVTRVLVNRPGAGAAAVRAQLERFRTEWTEALEKARAHGDARNGVVGETKLAALADVTARFPEGEA